MTLREILFAATLALAGAAIVRGVALLHEPAAWLTGGALFAVWSWLVLGDAA